MKKLACKNISPDTTCTFAVEAETDSEAASLMLAHARVEHAADIASMTDEDAVQLFKTKIPA